MTAGQRARERAKEIIDGYPGISIQKEIASDITAIMTEDIKKFGLSKLPNHD